MKIGLNCAGNKSAGGQEFCEKVKNKFFELFSRHISMIVPAIITEACLGETRIWNEPLDAIILIVHEVDSIIRYELLPEELRPQVPVFVFAPPRTASRIPDLTHIVIGVQQSMYHFRRWKDDRDFVLFQSTLNQFRC